MGVFKNDVGRPSNKTITIRNILKGILVIVLAAAIFAGGYALNGSQKKEDSSKKESKKTTTIVNKKNKTYNPKEAFDKLVKDHNLITYKDGEAYDLNGLKSINCISAIRAVVDGSVDTYSIEILEFSDIDSAKKEYTNQTKDAEDKDSAVVTIYSIDILDKKSTYNYDLIEKTDISDDIDGSDSKMYGYTYHLRINNYYICLYASNDKDMSDEMIKLKNELNTLLGIK